jgi:hypothetical protein
MILRALDSKPRLDSPMTLHAASDSANCLGIAVLRLFIVHIQRKVFVTFITPLDEVYAGRL